MSDEAAFFVRESPTRFRPTGHVSGGWNPDEQHIAPAIGLIAHMIEQDRDRRGQEALRLTRLSCDILGVLPLEPVDLSVTVLRAGRTIELVEARLDHDGRTAVIARAWLARGYDTAGIAGSSFPPIGPVEDAAPWDPTAIWPGGFIASLEARRLGGAAPGHAALWLRSRVRLLAGERVSPVAEALRLADAANGMATRVPPEEAAYPNLDLTIHLFREPEEGSWTGFETTVSFGPDGAGLTQAVLHDAAGPFGALAQTLTVRPRAGAQGEGAVRLRRDASADGGRAAVGSGSPGSRVPLSP